MLSIKELVEATNGILLNGEYDKIPKDYDVDSRIISRHEFFIPIVGESNDGHDYILDTVRKGACGFFVSSSFENKERVINEAKKINDKINIIEVGDTKKALVDAGRYNRNKHINIPVIAVSGSVGKTSTRQMIASVLKTEKNVLVTRKNYNSNIGVPIMCLQISDQDVCVLEAGIDKFGEMAELSDIIKPDIVAYTVIGSSHIGTFKTKEKIFEEKSNLLNEIKGIKKVIVNGDDIYLSTLISNNKYDVISYTIDTVKDINQKEDSLEFITRVYGNEEKVIINQIGNHNIYNALCAIKIGEIFNISAKNILKGIFKYENYSRRMEKDEIAGITIIDDAYNASPESMKSGLLSVDKLTAKRKFAIIGDIFDLGELSEKIHFDVSKIFAKVNYDFLYTLGEKSKIIAEQSEKYFGYNSIKSFNKMDDLAIEILRNVKEGDLLYFKASNGMKFNLLIDKVKKELENKEIENRHV